MTKSNENKSLPKIKTVHGVEIEKKPCGKYFEALQTLKNLPEDFIKELSDNGQDFKLSEMFTVENIMNLITRLLIILPDFTFNFLFSVAFAQMGKLSTNDNTNIKLITLFIKSPTNIYYNYLVLITIF